MQLISLEALPLLQALVLALEAADPGEATALQMHRQQHHQTALEAAVLAVSLAAVLEVLGVTQCGAAAAVLAGTRAAAVLAAAGVMIIMTMVAEVMAGGC